MQKLIVILGPTASGKSEMAVKLAKKFNGEVVSADSRQVYKRLNLGSGKVTKREMRAVPHHLLDVASLKRRYTVAQYQKAALAAIKKIHKIRKIPILCGGTGFYIQAVVEGLIIPKVKPDWKLRRELEKKSAKELFEKLKKLDPRRAKTIEQKNKRRLIRALEIVIKTEKPVPKIKKEESQFEVLIIGIKKSPEELKKLITKRLVKRIKQGMIAEVRKLKKAGLSWQRLESLGLEYRWITRYLQSKISYHQMLERIQKESEQFAKRQMVWFKRHPAPEPRTKASFVLDRQVRWGGSKQIKWIEKYLEAEKLVKSFLKRNLAPF